MARGRCTAGIATTLGMVVAVCLVTAPGAAQCPGPVVDMDFGEANQEVHGVAVAGDHAFAADDYGLTVYDVSGLPVLKKRAEVFLDAMGHQVKVLGSYAYVASGSGLSVYDVSDPLHPVLADSHFSSSGERDLAMDGDLLVTAGPVKISTFEIQPGGHVSYKGFLFAGSDSGGIDLVGTTAYLAGGAGGLVIIDVSTPASPVVVHTVAMPDRARDVAVSGDYAYVAARGAGLQVVDLAPPSGDPVIAGSYDTAGEATGVALFGSYVLVADGDAGLVVLDVSTPSSPTLASTFDTPGFAENVTVSGNLAYIADRQGGIRVVDLTDPLHPADAGGIVTAGTTEDVYALGYTEYVADGWGGLRLLSSFPPGTVTELGSCDVGGYATHVTATSGWAYVAVEGAGLAVVDTSVMTSPVLHGTLDVGTTIAGLTHWGDSVFIAGGYQGFLVADVSDPDNPVVTGSVPTNDFAADVVTDGTYAYVADASAGLTVVEVSGHTPAVVANLDTPGNASSVSKLGNLVVVGEHDTLRVMDVSDPVHPVSVGSLGGFSGIVDLEASHAPADDGTALVYVADFAAGLILVDLSDPAAPFVLASGPTKRHPACIGVGHMDGTAWLGTGPLLEGLDITCPTCHNAFITVDPDTIPSGGGTSTVTAHVFTLEGRPATGATVTGSTTLGALSAFVPGAESGSYEATLTSGPTTGDAVIHIAVDGTDCSAEAQVHIACAGGSPSPPGGLTATPAGSTSIDLDWTDEALAERYRVYRGTYMIAELVGSASSAFTDTGLSPGTEYCYTVTALDSCGGETAPSAEVCATTTGTSPTCPWEMSVTPRPDETGSGYYQAVTLGDTLIIGDDHGFSTWDAGDPSNPAFLSHWEAPDWAFDLNLREDGLLAVSMQDRGLSLVDVSDPGRPFLLAAVPDFAYRSSFGGNYLYLAGNTGLSVLYVRDPARPVQVFSNSVGGWATAVSGHHLFLSDFDSHLVVYDISDPAAPVQVGSWDAPGMLDRLQVEGSVLFATLTASDQLLVLDVSDPAHPALLAAYGAPDRVRDFTVEGDFAYLACDGAGLQVVDVSTPAAPVARGNRPTIGTARCVATWGTTAFVGDSRAIFDCIDVTDPDAPSRLWAGLRDGDVVDVAVSGTHVYAVLDDPGGLVIVDVSDPRAPVPQGSLNTPGEALGVAVSGGFAYIADGPGGFRVADVSDPWNPIGAGELATTYAQAVALSGSYAYVADSGSGLRIVDVSDPDVLSLASTLDTPGTARDVAVQGNYAFVADGPGGLVIVDAGDPHSPIELATVATAGLARRIAVEGDLAYVAEGLDGFQIFDVSNPGLPRLLSTTTDIYYFHDIQAHGTHVYATTYSAIWVYDAADPTRPQLIASRWTDPRTKWSLALSGDLAYIAGTWAMEIVSLGCQTPEARFEVTDRGLMQDFTDTSLYRPTSWAWDFGDGGTSSDQHPTHTYALPGDYTVTLTVTNGQGSDVTARTISVGCDLDHDGSIGGPDVEDELAEIYDSDGILASQAGGPDHLGSSQYDTNADGLLDGADLAWIIRRAR